jgi:cupin 2 domain-containing protein
MSMTRVRTAGVWHTGQNLLVAAIERGRLGQVTTPGAGEAFVALARLGPVVVEEIASSSSPDTRLQVQDHDEWVALLAGGAELDVDGARVTLMPGDWMVLPAGTPHRVLRTDAGSRWLAVHAP